ncbi:hypothetical protein [Paeniglutamicibacter cryotolerans]|uniref:DNA helicase TIP49 (TBP-interacting protein) n=1 Tax=Paeniglutamicibacter cryotolerans TaxID=670079 RepID=A0A839QPH0_9MICC|nr:hypothetical protein [Paeniglutamicibacter cryotolerans]MBB2997503.1 DNA helicase TIP49 (TBP-interacting protein) [Paeniglutamicibacter cryotolerans]
MSQEQHENNHESHQPPQSVPQGRWVRYGFKLLFAARVIAYKAIQEVVKSEIRELVQVFFDGSSGLS